VVAEEDWSLGARDLADKVFTYVNTITPLYDLFPDEWANEPLKIKQMVRRIIMKEFWKQRSCKEPILLGPTISFNLKDCWQGTWAPCLHASMDQMDIIQRRLHDQGAPRTSLTRAGAGRYAKPQAIVLNMSARPWRLNVHLHQPGPSKGGILTFPRDGTDGHSIKMR
jgi:hypothetical protein